MAQSIDAEGAVTGWGYYGGPSVTSFIRNPDGTFTLITTPYGLGDYALSINNGYVAGWERDRPASLL